VTLRVLINAGPWLRVPPDGYGGIENIVATLIPELRRRGVYVVLATVGDSSLPVDERLWRYDNAQFGMLQRPYNRVAGVAMAHIDRVVGELLRRGDIDLVHDHLEVVGPAVLGAMGGSTPPVLHTLHWDLAKHAQLYEAFDGRGRMYVNGVSAAQLARAPAALRAHSLGHVHLAAPLAGGADRTDRDNHRDRDEYVVALGRITPDKGQHVAAHLSHRAGIDLLLAGPVGPYHRPDALAAALATAPEAVNNPDVRYWRDKVMPLVDGQRVRWLGAVSAAERNEILVGAVASVFPLQWEEPGGTAVVESLALGTPIVGYRRGCLPELVDEASTGFLVDPGDEDELLSRLRAAASLNPAACRRAAATRFAPAIMAERYLDLYDKVVNRATTGMAEQLYDSATGCSSPTANTSCDA
jgi:glycosyltransferase involved in cell wall biosynthesis